MSNVCVHACKQMGINETRFISCRKLSVTWLLCVPCICDSILQEIPSMLLQNCFVPDLLNLPLVQALHKSISPGGSEFPVLQKGLECLEKLRPDHEFHQHLFQQQQVYPELWHPFAASLERISHPNPAQYHQLHSVRAFYALSVSGETRLMIVFE